MSNVSSVSPLTPAPTQELASIANPLLRQERELGGEIAAGEAKASSAAAEANDLVSSSARSPSPVGSSWPPPSWQNDAEDLAEEIRKQMTPEQKATISTSRMFEMVRIATERLQVVAKCGDRGENTTTTPAGQQDEEAATGEAKAGGQASSAASEVRALVPLSSPVPWLLSPVSRNPVIASRKQRNRAVRLVPAPGHKGLKRVGIECAADGCTLVIRDRDNANLGEMLYRCSPCLAQGLFSFVSLISFFFGTLCFAFVGLPLLPIAFLEMTNSSLGLFPGTNSTPSLANDSLTGNQTLVQSDAERPWSREVGQAATISLGLACAGNICYVCYTLLMLPNLQMMRRLWLRDGPAIAIKTALSWSYAVNVATIQPHPTHVLWVAAMALFAAYFEYTDAIAVTMHLRGFPPWFDLFISSRDGDKTHKAKSCTLGSTLALLGIVLILILDVFRHYLVTEFSEGVPLIVFDFVNPITDKPVVYTNLDLATSQYWTTIVFLLQSVYTILRKKMMQSTITSVVHYQIMGPEAGAPSKLIMVRKRSRQKLVLEHGEALARGKIVPLTLKSHPGKAIVLRYPKMYPLRKERRVYFVGVGDVIPTGKKTDADAGAPLMVKLEQGKFIMRPSDGFVLAKAIGGGNTVCGKGMVLVAGPSDEETLKAGCEFAVNADGTVSPVDAPHLVLGATSRKR